MIMKLSLIGMMFSTFTFIVYQDHCLSLLISLEAVMLSLLFYTYSLLSMYSSPFWFLVILTMAACEAALGLSLLVSMLRVRGNDSTSFLSTNKFFALFTSMWLKISLSMCSLGVSIWGQLNLMDASSPVQEEMILFHDHALVLLIGIFSFVAILGVKLTMNKFSSRTTIEAQRLETVWTIVPALLLVWLALPSLRLLYLMDDLAEKDVNSGIILKSTGHQWYWSYELPIVKAEFDSYMVPEADLNFGDHRLLEVDNRAVIPYQMDTTVIATSADVIHAWTLPSMGVKMDAVPGRLNSMGMFVEKPGVFYGQCSEICGANHSFMPIVVEAVKLDSIL